MQFYFDISMMSIYTIHCSSFDRGFRTKYSLKNAHASGSYIHIHNYTFMYICMYVCMHVPMYTMYVYTCVRVCIYIYIYIYVCIYAPVQTSRPLNSHSLHGLWDTPDFSTNLMSASSFHNFSQSFIILCTSKSNACTNKALSSTSSYKI